MTPLEVVIRAPKRPGGYWAARFVVAVGLLFGFAGLLVWLIPVAFHVQVGYWQAIAILVVVRLVLPKRSFVPHLEAGAKRSETNPEEYI